MPTSDDSTIWFVVRELSDDVRRMEDKWSSLIENTAKVATTVQSVSNQVDKISVAVMSGQKDSIVDRMYHLQSEVGTVRDGIDALNKVNDAILKDLEHIKQMSGIFKTKEEIQKERWQSIGRVSAVLLALATGLVAFFRTLHS